MGKSVAVDGETVQLSGSSWNVFSDWSVAVVAKSSLVCFTIAYCSALIFAVSYVIMSMKWF